jgi:CrcB protein
VIVWVAIGGAIGAVARYALTGAVQRYASSSFPYGTFLVNVLGCFAFGLIFGLTEHRFSISPALKTFLLVGVLGGFTTFSSYTFESFQLIRDAFLMKAIVNAIGQVVVGLACFWMGWHVNRWL